MQAMAKAMSERTSRSRSSIRWERKVSWLSWASGIAALLARGAVARRGVGGRRVDSQLELRRGRGGRGRIVGGRGAFLEAALDRGFRVVHLALHLARLRLDLALEGPRRVFELGLHLAELRQLHLAIDIGLHLGNVALQAPEEHAHRARDLGQALGPDHHQGHDAADDELGKAEVEHVWTRGARRGTQEAPAPGNSALLLVLDLAFDGAGGRGDLTRGLLLLLALHAFLEALHRAAEVRAHVAQLLRAEDEQHDDEHDQPMPDAQ